MADLCIIPVERLEEMLRAVEGMTTLRDRMIRDISSIETSKNPDFRKFHLNYVASTRRLIEEIEQKISESRGTINRIKTQLEYMPGAPGYLRARDHFYELAALFT